MPEKTGKKQEESRFQKGYSGNPRGRPKGARGKATILAQTILDNGIGDICNRLIVEAKNGNMQAIKIVIDRVLPVRKELPIAIDLPQIKAPSDLLEAIDIVTRAIGEGKISPSEGEALTKIIETNMKVLELHDLEVRLNTLEMRAKN